MLRTHLPLFLLLSRAPGPGFWGRVVLDEGLLPVGWDLREKMEMMRRTVMSAHGPGTMDPTSCCSPHLKI